MEQGSLAGKVVVVTGAARGLGREYARHLARQGALVTAADIQDVDETVAEITADGGHALAVTVDVGDEPNLLEILLKRSKKPATKREDLGADVGTAKHEPSQMTTGGHKHGSAPKSK